MNIQVERFPQSSAAAPISQLIRWVIARFSQIPDALIALIARLSVAAVFWQAGQTKIQGFVVDIVNAEVHLGWPRLSDSVIPLFMDEYRLPLISPAIAAPMAAFGEHFFPLLLVLGLATRFSALAMLGMTLVIQFLVYPGSYATHGTWAAVLLFLMAHGPGKISLDYLVAKRWPR